MTSSALSLIMVSMLSLFECITRSLSVFLEEIKLIAIDCMFYHVTYAFQSESTLYSCLNVKELLARSRREI